MNDASPHDEAILLTRGPDLRVIVAAVLVPLATIAAGIAAFAHIMAIAAPTTPSTHIDTVLAWIWSTVTLLGVVIAAYYIRAALTKAVFGAESAKLVTLGRVRRTMRYSHCQQFTYRRQRTYEHGVWLGTYFNVRLAAKGHKPIALSGRHKERPTLRGLTVLKKEFRGADEIDLLPAHIGGIIADTWEKRLAAGEQIRWLRGFVLTDAGMIPRSGPFKRQCVPYHRVSLIAENMEVCELVIEGERPMAVDIDTSTANFWPGAIMIERRSESACDSNEDTDEDSERDLDEPRAEPDRRRSL